MSAPVEITLFVAFKIFINRNGFLYYVMNKNKQNYLKRLETEVEFAILFIASEIIGAIEIISIFLDFTNFFRIINCICSY